MLLCVQGEVTSPDSMKHRAGPVTALPLRAVLSECKVSSSNKDPALASTINRAVKQRFINPERLHHRHIDRNPSQPLCVALWQLGKSILRSPRAGTLGPSHAVVIRRELAKLEADGLLQRYRKRGTRRRSLPLMWTRQFTGLGQVPYD